MNYSSLRNLKLPVLAGRLSIVLLLVMTYVSGFGQIRFVSVDPSTNDFTIKNFGSSAVDISSYRWCSEFNYTPNPLSNLTLVSGSLNLAAGAEVTLNQSVTTAAADLGLYLPAGSFGDPAAMVDFVQWGAGGIGREGVANTKGIWTAGTFLTGAGPFTYTGSGSQNGTAYWRAAGENVRLFSVNPVTDEFTIKNFGTNTVDVSAYRWCSEFVYSPGPLGSLTLVSGSLNLAPGATATIGGITFDEVDADFGLYLPTGGFSDTAAMLDFVQWGASVPGRENVAVSKGIWGAGDFLAGDAPYDYIGNGNEDGVAFWTATVVNTVDYQAFLSGNQEVLPVMTGGEGSVTASLDGDTLRVSGSFENLRGKFAASHIHNAYAGRNGGVEFPLNVVADSDSLGGTIDPAVNKFALSAQQVQDLQDRKFYVNVHSAMFPGGELRGQILPPADEYFSMNLFGSNEVPSVISGGSGAIMMELTGDTLILSGSFMNLEGDFAASHLHAGLAGQNGGVEIGLSVMPDVDSRGGVYEAAMNTYTLSATQKDMLEDRALYTNVHTAAVGSGELRGQVNELSHVVFRTHLSGANQLNPVTTGATGELALELEDSTLTVSGSFTGLESKVLTSLAGGAHIHLGIAGRNGGVEIPLTLTLNADSTSGTIDSDNNEYDLTAAQYDALFGRKLYVNIHTEDNGGGELRGQIVPEAQVFFTGFMTGMQTVKPINSTGHGALVAEVMGDKLTLSGSFDELKGMYTVSHIHIAPVGSTGGVLELLNPSLDAGNQGGMFEASAHSFTLSSGMLDTLKARWLYVNVHSDSALPGEIRTQLFHEATSYFLAPLSGTSATTPVNSTGNGNVAIELTGNVAYTTGSFRELATDFDIMVAGGAHIHGNRPGQNGGIVFGLNTGLAPSNREGTFSGADNTFTLSAGEVDSLRQRLLYVNIHTLGTGSGEIRGNFLNLANTYFTTHAQGKNETTPVASSGSANLKLELNGDKLVVTGAISNLAGNYAASHLHLGAPGSNGGVEQGLNLTVDGDMKGGFYNPDSNTYVLTATQVEDLRAGHFYLNVHTDSVGSGEIRGQILPESNFFPDNSATITSPADGVFVSIDGPEATPFQADWTSAIDPDGNALVYIWQLALDSAFNTLLLQQNVGPDLSFGTDFSAVDSILEANGVNVGDTVTVLHRAIASDGSVCGEGMLSSVNLVRGNIWPTDIDDQLATGFEMRVFPSPASDVVTFRTEGQVDAAATLRVMDLLGREVHQRELRLTSGIQNHVIQTDAYQPGVYLVQLILGDLPLAPVKFVKQ